MTWDRFMDVLPILTFILGAGLSLLTESLRSRWNETARLRAAREELAASTIVQLQPLLSSLYDISVDCSAAIDQIGEVPDELADKRFKPELEADALVARLPDGPLRAQVHELLLILREYAFGSPGGPEVDGKRTWVSGDSKSTWTAARDQLRLVNDGLGSELRSLYEPRR